MESALPTHRPAHTRTHGRTAPGNRNEFVGPYRRKAGGGPKIELTSNKNCFEQNLFQKKYVHMFYPPVLCFNRCSYVHKGFC